MSNKILAGLQIGKIAQTRKPAPSQEALPIIRIFCLSSAQDGFLRVCISAIPLDNGESVRAIP
jgi:hypothetical protein